MQELNLKKKLLVWDSTFSMNLRSVIVRKKSEIEIKQHKLSENSYAFTRLLFSTGETATQLKGKNLCEKIISYCF